MKNFQLINIDETVINMKNVGNTQGFEYPEIIAVITDVPGRSGAFYVKSDYGRRRLSWEGITDNVDDRRDVLAIQIGALKTLKFDLCDDISVQTEIAILRLTMPYKTGRSKYLIEAVAPDYRFFSQTLTSQSTAPTISSGGVSLPTELPMDFSNVTGVPYLTLTNNGDEPTPPIFTIDGPGTNFTIQNITSGGIFQLNTSITATDQIVVDVANQTIILNGTTNIYGVKTGNLWDIPSGTSELNFAPQTGSDTNTLLTVEYRSAYKGL